MAKEVNENADKNSSIKENINKTVKKLEYRWYSVDLLQGCCEVVLDMVLFFSIF